MVLPRPRSIRSFVRREGRLTRAQRRAVEQLSKQFCLTSVDALGDLGSVYRRHAPRVLEIGCGTGEVIVSLARSNPNNDYLGIEVYKPGLGQALNGLEEGGLGNVRMLGADAAVALSQAPRDIFDMVCIFFPDPWPKKRHHKRRLIQPAFARQLRLILKSHGRVFVATDWGDYAEQILSVFSGSGFFNLAGAERRSPRPRWRPLTRYERRALSEGREIWDFAFGKAYRTN